MTVPQQTLDLLEAARYGELEQTSSLLSDGVAPDAQDESGRTGRHPFWD